MAVTGGNTETSLQERAEQRFFEIQRKALYRWLNRILAVGFWASFLLIVSGLVLAAVRREPLGDEVAPLVDVIPNAIRLSPQAVVDLGLLSLLLTPAAYVAVSLVIFARQRDRPFVIVCCALLGIMMVSVGIGLR